MPCMHTRDAHGTRGDDRVGRLLSLRRVVPLQLCWRGGRWRLCQVVLWIVPGRCIAWPAECEAAAAAEVAPGPPRDGLCGDPRGAAAGPARALGAVPGAVCVAAPRRGAGECRDMDASVARYGPARVDGAYCLSLIHI